MKIVAVTNQKGGVGKTTTAINLSYNLAMLGKSILLIDLDPQANATSGLGIDPKYVSKGTYDVLLGEESCGCVVEVPHYDLDLLPASPDLAGAEVELVSVYARESRLKDAIIELVKPYDFVIIDTPPTLGLLTINAFTAADNILVPMQCEYYALEGFSQLLKTLNLVRNRLNRNLGLTKILMTMFDRRNNLSFQIEDEIRRHFKSDVFQTLIPRNVKLSEAPSYGQPISVYDQRSKGAIAYQQFSKEFLEHMSQFDSHHHWGQEEGHV